MVSQNRLKLYIFKMQRFFCNIYPRPAQYFQYCRFLLLLKCIPPTHVYGILTFKRDITQLYSENLLKMPKCVFFSKFSYLSTFTPVFFTYERPCRYPSRVFYSIVAHAHITNVYFKYKYIYWSYLGS